MAETDAPHPWTEPRDALAVPAHLLNSLPHPHPRPQALRDHHGPASPWCLMGPVLCLLTRQHMWSWKRAPDLPVTGC